jgi:ubiquinone/menaquinone biosynthesis C-methylase UbiE
MPVLKLKDQAESVFKGSVSEFDENWKIQKTDAHQNYFSYVRPVNQIMMSFQNQWTVYRSFLPADVRGLKVLEPGSGRGSISSYFAFSGCTTYLLDTSFEVLRTAQSLARENRLTHRYICGDALGMPFNDNHFDVIVHCGLLEHFEDYQAVLAEQFRVLKPGGIIIANIVPKKWSVQRCFSFVNVIFSMIYQLLKRLKMVDPVLKESKKPVYRSAHGAQVYSDGLRSIGAEIVHQGGLFPVPSLSYSPAFPFTLMPGLIEKMLVWLWTSILYIRKLMWPRRHPWQCSELWGQHLLVVARKK